MSTHSATEGEFQASGSRAPGLCSCSQVVCWLGNRWEQSGDPEGEREVWQLQEGRIGRLALEAEFSKYCSQSTLRQKLQNTANLYTQRADLKHFSTKLQFEQESFPWEDSGRQSNKGKSQEIGSKSKRGKDVSRWQG